MASRAARVASKARELYRKLAGVRGVDSRYGMSTAQYNDIKKALKNNGIFIYKLTSLIDKIGTEAFLILIARSLDYVVRDANIGSGGTIHDTGRAAANWDVNVSGINPRGRDVKTIDPHRYPYDRSAEYNSRKEKYWARAGADLSSSIPSKEGLGPYRSYGDVSSEHVPAIKAVKYGYTWGIAGDTANGINVDFSSQDVDTGGWLRQVFDGKLRPAVHLVNPIFGNTKTRPDGHGTSYQANAFPGVAELETAVESSSEIRIQEFVIIVINEFNRKAQADLAGRKRK